MAAPSVDKLVKSFEKPNIPPIDREPTYAMLHTMHEILKSTRHLSPPTSAVALSATCASPYPPPYMAPSRPEESSPLSILAQRPSSRPARLAPKQLPSDMNTTRRRSPSTPSRTSNRALCQQLLGAVEDTFLRVLHKPHRGYS